jgi:type IV secretory pathway TraG/TraD family ATPase VirD4
VTRSVSKEAGWSQIRRYLYSESKRELITPDEVRQLGVENVIIFADEKAPIKAKRLAYFKSPWMKPYADLPATPVKPIVGSEQETIKPGKVQKIEEEFLEA